MKGKDLLKQVIPGAIWEYLRKNRGRLIDTFRSGSGEMCEMDYFGYTLRYSKGMSIIDRVRGGKVFEPELVDSIVQDLRVKEKPILCDIGANIGLISLPVVRRVPAVRIFAFEPGPHQQTLLSQTIHANNLGPLVHLEKVALGEEDGLASFVTHADRDVAKDGFVDTGRAADPRVISVEVKKLDSWWETAGSPDVTVLKLDTEGSEIKILKGGERMLSILRPIIYLEIEHKNLSAYNFTPDDLMKWFSEHGYRLETLEGTQITIETIYNEMKRTETFRASPIE